MHSPRVAAVAALAVVGMTGVTGLALMRSSRDPTIRPRPTVRAPVREVVLGGVLPVDHGLREAREVGRRFLRGYVAFLHGRLSADELEGASSDLRRALRRARVRVPPARAVRRPAIVGVRAFARAPGVVLVIASVADGDLAAYSIAASVERRPGRWLVTGLAGM
jgi:hypothetical protein